MLLFLECFGDKTLSPEKVPIVHRCTRKSPTVCVQGSHSADRPRSYIASVFFVLLYLQGHSKLDKITRKKIVDKLCLAKRAGTE